MHRLVMGMPIDVVSLVGVPIDIAQQRLAERQTRQVYKVAAVGHLTGGISHDINNLPAIIPGNPGRPRRCAKVNDRLREMV